MVFKRSKFSKKKFGRKRSRRHTKKHSIKRSKYGNANGILRMRGPAGWFPPRAVVKSSIQSDWQAMPPIAAGATYSFAVKLNSVYQPLVNTPVSTPFSYQGLATLMNSTHGFTDSIYHIAKVMWCKITLEMNRATNPVNSMEVALFPDVDNTSVITSPFVISNMPNSVVRTYMNDSTHPLHMSRSVSVRKMIGLTKASYSDELFASTTTTDPTQTYPWVLAFRPLNSAAEAAGTYSFRVKLEALIQLNQPWDPTIIVPPFAEEEKKEDFEMPDEPEISLKKLKFTPSEPIPLPQIVSSVKSVSVKKR